MWACEGGPVGGVRQSENLRPSTLIPLSSPPFLLTPKGEDK